MSETDTSAAIDARIRAMSGDIERLRAQASAADAKGQFGRADGLRSKARELTCKLDTARGDHATALHREETGPETQLQAAGRWNSYEES